MNKKNMGAKNHRSKSKKINKEKLTFMPLGGVEGVNRNCYVLEYGGDILVIDMGLSFPEYDEYGVDYLIPDVNYLKKNRNRIKGIVVTHAHLDHVGALPHVLEDLNFPKIYARQFTQIFVKEKLKEYGLDRKANFKVVEPKQNVQVGKFQVRLVPVTHSIPQASSVYVKTPGGSVLHSGDFKFDDNPVNEPKPDYEEFKRIGREGVDLLAIECTNIYMEGRAKSETEIHKILDGIIGRARGRVFAATFSSLGTRLYSLIEIAKKHKRKIAVTGRSMKTMLSLLRRINYIQASDDLFVSEDQASKMPGKQVLVLSTGTQGEEMAALSRLARDEHARLKIKRGDTVLLSSSVIPGNQISVQHLIDDLLEQGAKVIHQSFMDVHTSGHGNQEDIRKMYDLVKPKNVMPIHGYKSFIHEAAYWFGKWGASKNNILIADVGQKFVYNTGSGRWSKGDKIQCQDVYVESGTVGEIGQAVLNERDQLATYGVVVVVLKLGSDHKPIGEPEVVTRGFVYVKANKSLLNRIKQVAKDAAWSWRKSDQVIQKGDFAELEDLVSRDVSRMISKDLDRKPAVETVVVR